MFKHIGPYTRIGLGRDLAKMDLTRPSLHLPDFLLRDPGCLQRLLAYLFRVRMRLDQRGQSALTEFCHLSKNGRLNSSNAMLGAFRMARLKAK
jgi:hypothetical protein